MNAEIITIGDEILIGQIVDTNSAWMGKELNLNGIKIRRITSVSDEADEIIFALETALGKADLILITGGLGPTRDDLTKHTLARFFNSKLVMNAEALENVTQIFRRFDRPMLDVNTKQAELPENCIPIQNRNGTAPGMWFDHKGKVIVSMPGVPHEMKAMMKNAVLPMLHERFSFPGIVHHTILTGGIGESFLAERLSSFEDQMPSFVKLAYLPHLGTVRLRLSGYGSDKDAVQKKVRTLAEQIIRLVPEYVVAQEDISLQQVVLQKMKTYQKSLSLAESCTGGYISHLFTSIPGSSEVFQGSIIAYSNALKQDLLGVKSELIEKAGAVSEEVVREMAAGALVKNQTDYAIAVTGIAGPGGGTDEKPVGTTWIAVANKNKIESRKFSFGKERLQNIDRSAISAILMLFHFLEDQEMRGPISEKHSI